MTHHFEWHEQQDFSGGLWTVGDPFALPPNACQLMTDCHAMPNGGLRAGPRWIEESMTNVTSHTGGQVFGFAYNYAHGSHSPDVLYLATSTSTPSAKIFNKTPGNASWSTTKTHAFLSGPGQVTFAPFIAGGSGSPYMYWNFDQSTANDGGIWRDDGTPTRVLSMDSCGPLTAHQARLVFLQDFNGWDTYNRLRWSDAGSDSAFATTVNFLDLGLEKPGVAAWAYGFEPSDLMVMRGNGLTLVQGDITQPLVRELTANRPGAFPVWTDVGLVYVTIKEGVYLWNGGQDVEPLSPQLDYASVAGPALGSNRPGFVTHYILSPGGAVYDLVTKSWFKSTNIPNSSSLPAAQFATYPGSNQVFVARSPTSGGAYTVASWTATEATNDGNRSNSWTLQTAPFSLDGRLFEVRELELHFRAFATSSLTVTVTPRPSGTVYTRTLTNVMTAQPGGNILRIPVNVQPQEYFDITLSTSCAAGSEAPLLRKIRFGTIPRQRLVMS